MKYFLFLGRGLCNFWEVNFELVFLKRLLSIFFNIAVVGGVGFYYKDFGLEILRMVEMGGWIELY